MTIKQVHYRRLWNLGNYENISVELVADIGEDDPVAAALDTLATEAMMWKTMRGKKKVQEVSA